jgi:hypothetical protein
MQAIITKYYEPTNTRGSRITAKCDAGSVTIPYPYELSGEAVHRKAAEALRDKLGWNTDYYGNMASGQIPGGDYVFVFVK